MTGSAAAGALRTRNRSRTSIYGSGSMSWRTRTKWYGSGCAAIPGTMATSAPTYWPTAASTRWLPEPKRGVKQLMRQIVLDTETTGLEPELGHRVIELAGVEILNRRATGNKFHRYLNPERESDEAALRVHGLTTEFLQDKPRFADVARDFVEYVADSELIIHNARFDVVFLTHGLQRVEMKR